jgi:hypothetical protein
MEEKFEISLEVMKEMGGKCKEHWKNLFDILESTKDNAKSYYGLFDCCKYIGIRKDISLQVDLLHLARRTVEESALKNENKHDIGVWYYCKLIQNILQVFMSIDMIASAKVGELDIERFYSEKYVASCRPYLICTDPIPENLLKEYELHLYILKEFLITYVDDNHVFNCLSSCINYLIEKRIDILEMQSLLHLILKRNHANDKEQLLNCLLFTILLAYDSIITFLLTRNLDSQEIEEAFKAAINTKENENEK